MSTIDLDGDHDEIRSFNFDFSIAGDVRDPYPQLAEWRESTPVREVPSALGPEFPNGFQIFRFHDVQKMFRDNHTFSSSNLRATMGDVMGQQIILGMDEPEHRRHRALVSTAFRNRVLARWEETLIKDVVNGLIDKFADRGHAELVSEFTFNFPTEVVAGVLGLNRDDYKQFQEWAVAIISVHRHWERGIKASEELKAYLSEILERRRVEPKDDVISDLAHAELDGEKLDDEEIFSFLRLLLPAGIETTFRSSGNLIYLLLTHPDQLEAVCQNRELMPQAIEEALRFETPLLITGRITTQDTELNGVQIPKGSGVTPMIGAANRDPEVFADPDRFDIFRKQPHQHISFGHGVHVCLGMHLARLETRVAIDALLTRLPNLRLDPERVERDDPHIHGEVFRSPTSLPVIWDT